MTAETHVRFRACGCGRPHCREYRMEFVDRRGRVVAVQEGEGIEWQEFFKEHLEAIEALARPWWRKLIG